MDLAELVELNLSPASLTAWGVAITLDGELHQLKETARSPMNGRVSFEVPGCEVTWDLELSSSPGEIVVRGRIHNRGADPVVLGKVFPVYNARFRWGEIGDEIRLLPYQSQGEQRVYDLHDPELGKEAKIKTQGWNRTRGVAVQAAFLTFEDIDTNVIIEPVDTTPAHMSPDCVLSAFCDFDRWSLPAGGSVPVEDFRLLVGSDPYSQLEDWAQQAADRIQPVIWEESPHGWLGWSWVDAINGKENYESVALGNLKAIRRRLNGLGIDYLWTSMNNFEGSQPGNWLKWNHRNIPMGREAFLCAVREQGFIPGFWIGPFYISSALPDLVADLAGEDALLHDTDDSLLVVCPEWRHGDAGLMPRAERAHLYSLDPTHPKALKFLEHVFDTYHQWGVRYYMVDFLEAAAGKLGRFPYGRLYDDTRIPGPQAYRRSLQMIKQVAGDDTFLLSSSGPKMHNAGPIDGVRVGNDLGEGRAITVDSFFYPASYVINKMSFWTAAAYALNCMGANYHTHRKLYINNAGNVLTVGKPMSLNEARVMSTIHAISGGPTMLGDDIRRLSPERLRLISCTFPRSAQSARPIDLFDSVSPEGPRRFHRHIESACGSYDILALFNLTRLPQTMIIDLSELGIGTDEPCLAWEYWNERYAGRFEKEVTIHLAPESTQVLRITRDTGSPQVVGTDMHVMMGETEISAFSYDPESMACDLTVTRPRGQTGMVFLHAPADLRIKNFDGLHIAKDGRDESLIVGVPLDFADGDSIHRHIQFGPLEESRAMSEQDLA